MLADLVVLIRAVLSGQLTWLPNGSEMPEETNCRFAASQVAQLPGEGTPSSLPRMQQRGVFRLSTAHKNWRDLHYLAKVGRQGLGYA